MNIVTTSAIMDDLYFLFSKLFSPKLMQSSISQETQPSGAENQHVDPKIASRFQICAKIGSGAYGHVWKVRCKSSGKTYALKKVFLAFQNETDAQRVYREVSLLHKIKHGNIIRLREVIPAPETKDIYLLFDYMQSDLFKAIKNRVLDLSHKKYIVYQLACALKYLHSAGIVHRDLKPSNVLINSNCQVMICDFGLSRTLKSPAFEKPLMTEFIATRWYRAPQVLLGSQCYDEQSDMWSLGCLIYELYSRRTLLPGENTIDQITKMLQFKGRPTPQELASLRAPKAEEILSFFKFQKQSKSYYYQDIEVEEIKHILDNLFHYDPSKRWNTSELLECQFLQQYRNSLPQNIALVPITLALNDNKRYRIDKYRQALLRPAQTTTQRSSPFLMTAQKRQPRSYHSHRGDMNSTYSIGKTVLGKMGTEKNQLKSAAYKRLIQSNKKFQSAHVSPNKKSSHQIRNSVPFPQKLKISDRLQAAYLPLGQRSNQGRLSKSQKSLILLKRSTRKSSDIKILKKGREGRQTKQNSIQGVSKTLKREKVSKQRFLEASLKPNY